MRRGGIIVILLVLGALSAGCADVRSERMSYGGWRDAHRIVNSEIELIVVPSAGRIVHYGFRDDGVNRLWTNPSSATAQGSWRNWGGDKAWVWPQDDWPRAIGRAWPPPGDPPTEAYRVETIPRGGLRLTSPVIEGYGLRIVREIRLSAIGSRVEITSWFEPVKDAMLSSDIPVAVWAVTQVPPPERIVARCIGEPRVYPVENREPFDIERADELTLHLTPSLGASGKIGLDADALSASYADVTFVQRASPSRAQSDAIAAGVGAQLFNEPAPPAQYVELEFTGPMHRVAEGPSPLRVVWELVRRPSP